jgi:quinol monooxygenase YgiN
MLHDNADKVLRTLDGWISSSTIASADGKRVVVHSQWRDNAAIAAMRADARMTAYFPKFAALASFEAIVGEVSHHTEA